VRHASVATALLLLAVACSSAPPPKPIPIPVSIPDAPRAPVTDAREPAPKAAAVDTTSWVKDWPKTWADARVVDALVARCDFEPPANTAEADEMSSPADLLRCTLAYSQGCAPDACASTTDACEEGCTTTCRVAQRSSVVFGRLQEGLRRLREAHSRRVQVEQLRRQVRDLRALP